MIELLQNIAGVVGMIGAGIVNGINGVVQLLPFSQELISYLPVFMLFPCTVILSFALVRFVMTLF